MNKQKLFFFSLLIYLTGCGPANEMNVEQGTIQLMDEIGYSSYAEAFDELNKKSYLDKVNRGGWLMISDYSDHTTWSFATENHWAHPSLTRRTIIYSDAGKWEKFGILCEAEKIICEALTTDQHIQLGLIDRPTTREEREARRNRPRVSLSFTTNKRVVDDATKVTLTWQAKNAQRCLASGAWSGEKAAAGAEQVGPLNDTSRFHLSCTDVVGKIKSRSVTVKINKAAAQTAVQKNPNTAVIRNDNISSNKTTNRSDTANKKLRQAYKKVLAKNTGIIYHAYNRYLRKNSSLEGKTIFIVSIKDSGEIASVRVSQSELQSQALLNELVEILSRFNLPDGAYDGGSITFPIDFKPGLDN